MVSSTAPGAFGPLFAGEIRRRRVDRRNWSNLRWHLDEVFVRINGETHYQWRAVDHEGEVLEDFVTQRRDRRAALKFLKRAMKHYGRPHSIVTDRLARTFWARWLSLASVFRGQPSARFYGGGIPNVFLDDQDRVTYSAVDRLLTWDDGR